MVWGLLNSKYRTNSWKETMVPWIFMKLTQSHLEKGESEDQSEATVTDSADKTEVLCQNKKDILITQQTEQGFYRNHIPNINNYDQRRISQHHNIAATNYKLQLPLSTKI